MFTNAAGAMSEAIKRLRGNKQISADDKTVYSVLLIVVGSIIVIVLFGNHSAPLALHEPVALPTTYVRQPTALPRTPEATPEMAAVPLPAATPYIPAGNGDQGAAFDTTDYQANSESSDPSGYDVPTDPPVAPPIEATRTSMPQTETKPIVADTPTPDALRESDPVHAVLQDVLDAQRHDTTMRPPDVSAEDARKLLHGRDPCSVRGADPATCKDGLWKPTPVQ